MISMGILTVIRRGLLLCIATGIPITAVGQSVRLHPMLQSIGIEISVTQDVDSCTVRYQRKGEDVWLQGFRLDDITIDGSRQFRGSLFLLEPDTEYQISIYTFSQSRMRTLPVETVRTLAEPTDMVSSNVIRWVSPNGSGAQYTREQPGNLTALFSQESLPCGTTVMLLDGVYHDAELRLNFANDCHEQSPVVIMASPGAKPIIEGGIRVKSRWTPHPNDPNLFWTSIPAEAAFSTICRLGSRVLYPYPSLGSELLLGGYNLAALSFGYDGFVRDDRTVWIRTTDGIEPNDSVVTLSTASRFLTLRGNDKAVRLVVRGLTFKHFGRPILQPLGSEQDSYPACAFDVRSAHQLTFDNCHFEYCTAGIVLNGGCDDVIIQNCRFMHGVGKWSHAMVKKSHDAVHTLLFSVASSRGRAVESPAIFIENGSRLIVRRNHFEGVNSGIEGYFDKGLKQEVDISDNVFIDNFDAIECDGLWCNLRAWHNIVIRPMAGISAAPPLIGPRTFYRNVISGMAGRRAEADDVFFVECSPVGSNYRNQGLAIKTNSGYNGNIAPGSIYFLNNTFHSEDSLGFSITSERAEWKSATFINNSITHGTRHPIFFSDLGNRKSNGTFQLSSINDNFFSYQPGAPIAVAQEIYGQYRCIPIGIADALQSMLSDISGSSRITVQAPLQQDPLFIDRNGDNFELSVASPLVEAGVPVPGFYDYSGLRPDVGAKEFISVCSIKSPEVDSLLAYPQPVSEFLHIRREGANDDAMVSVLDLQGRLLHSELCTMPECSVDLRSFPDGPYIITLHSPSRCTSYLRVIKL